MLNTEILKEYLKLYKEHFLQKKRWENEKYKWVAIKHFQENWDVNAEDFPKMLSNSLAMTGNLLASTSNFPANTIVQLAKAAPDEVRAMFIRLFDEDRDFRERIQEFKDKATLLQKDYGEKGEQSYQHENAISTYLWLRYPDKHYIYKYSEAKTGAEVLKSNFAIKKGSYSANLKNFMDLCDEIRDELQQDTELIKLFKDNLTDDCYPDPKYRTLAMDIDYFIYSIDKEKKRKPTEEWWPAHYSPGFTVDEWKVLLNNPEIFYPNSLEIMKRMKDYGGQATCKQLAVKYGETQNFYNQGSWTLAKRIVEKTRCPILEEGNENARWWPVLYLGRKAGEEEEGAYLWKLRDELSKALDGIDLSGVSLYASPKPGEETHGYWWLNANPKIWSFSNLNVGDMQSYTLYNEIGNKRRIFQNFLDARAGDMIIGYESNPVKQIVAIGKISAEQDGKEIYFEKIEGLVSPIDYATLKSCPELEKMEYFVNAQGSLFKLTKGEYDFILDLIREENPLPASDESLKYGKEDFLSEVFMSEARYETLVAVLRNKKNIILQGAPGVGKTFAAKRLAYSMMGVMDESRIELVQFHQSYSYEDFIMGYKPSDDGFEMKSGIFYRFCQKAANQPDKEFFFIIDEINRGNMSKIFGELLMLIERDYRGTKTTLAYNGLPFSVPKNLHLIGMMNTADRSLAMLDYALRRRFSFFDLEPGFESVGFIRYLNELDNETLNMLVDRIKDLNKEIASDQSLGKGFSIGHSYFCGQTACTEEWLKSIVEFDILPMLSEYWFDDQAKLQRWENILHGVFQ